MAEPDLGLTGIGNFITTAGSSGASAVVGSATSVPGFVAGGGAAATKALRNVGRNPAQVINNGGSASALSKTASYTYPVDLPPVHLNIVEADIKISTNINKPGNIITTDHMYRLPLPLQMTDNQEVAYNDNMSYLQAAATAATSIGGAATAALAGAASAAAQLGGALSGVVVNTLKGVALEQPMFKKHQMSWKLSPKTAEESARIQRIITKMKIGALPHQDKNFGRGILHFPKIFIPYFYPNVKFMYKFKPCVMTNIEVDYIGGNQAPAFFAQTNAPESLILKITLLEIEYWMREDMREEKLDAAGLPSGDFQDPFNFVKVVNLSGVDINS